MNSSTCSEILSSKWARLDEKSVPVGKDSYRSREGNWKVLEDVLFEWVQRYEAGKDPLTDTILREKALQFWNELPFYQGLSAPKLSEGWITSFRHRHNIRQRRKHGGPRSADNSEQTAEFMAEIRDTSALFRPEDIFHMDETGFFWKMVPDRSLGAERVSVQKQDKARVTAVLTCNATGSRKLPIWFIGECCNTCFQKTCQWI